jgi:hypothetical protein
VTVSLAADQAVEFSDPVVSDLERLRRVAVEDDDVHVVSLGEGIQCIRNLYAGRGAKEASTRAPQSIKLAFELVQLGLYDFAGYQVVRVLDLSGREPGVGRRLDSTVWAEIASILWRLPFALNRGEPFELASARRALTPQETLRVERKPHRQFSAFSHAFEATSVAHFVGWMAVSARTA